jgi:hypothetical protein
LTSTWLQEECLRTNRTLLAQLLIDLCEHLEDGEVSVIPQVEEAIGKALVRALTAGVRLGALDVQASAIAQGVDLQLTWSGEG